MKRHLPLAVIVLWTATQLDAVHAAEDQPATSRVYGEWRIRVRPDKGLEYNKLIEREGLPLFREAGGRMVGWWHTLIGDLYEHVTIWEYDNMAAFERAIGFLGPDQRFGRFVAQRDLLLSGEESRFLRLVESAEPPRLPEPARFVIHEIHRMPLRQRAAYLRFMTGEGLAILKTHGFRPAGPWVVDVGRWTECTLLFRFESLAERERLIAAFTAHADAERYGGRVNELVSDITTRLLVPAPFSPRGPAAGRAPVPVPWLPHVEQVAPGVYAAGSAHRHGSANCGWLAAEDGALLIDVPHGAPIADFLSLVEDTTGKPARRLVLTRFREADAPFIEALYEHGVATIVTSPEIRRRLDAASDKISSAQVQAASEKHAIGGAMVSIDFIPLDDIASTGGAAVHLPQHALLFAGSLVTNGPRAALPGRDTARWVAALRHLERLAAARIVPGFGSWGGSQLLARQHRYLKELRRQVAYGITMGRPLGMIQRDVLLPASYYAWMPYDEPTAEDIEHVFRELTVPAAPFNGRQPEASDDPPNALVLIGDRYHEPEHCETGLAAVFEATGVVPHFAVDVRALSAENLARVKLLVVLRDGMLWPDGRDKPYKIWMTPEQERAVVDFVERGGSLLNLHNSMGFYPKDGAYLHLVGGNYTGHGPLERFRVEVTDPDHPVTRGVLNFSVADEQHTPEHDQDRVQLLLRSRSDEGKVAAAGWIREPGRGRVCHLANGHTRESLLHPMYQLLLRNAVNWCLRRNVR